MNGKPRVGFLAALRIPVSLLLLGILAFAAYYFVYAQRKSSYLTDRNLRLLAVAGQRLDSRLGDLGTVLASFATRERVGDLGRFVSELDDGRSCQAGDAKSGYVLRDRQGGGDLEITHADAGCWQATAELREILDPILGPLVDDRVFDTVLLATGAGRVVYERGAESLQVADLSALIALGRAEASNPPDASAAKLRLAASAVESVPLAGSSYRLFLHPLSLAVSSEREGAPHGWVIAGLISGRRLISDSLAISTSLLAVITSLLLLAIFSYPFVKLALIGARQRIQVIDVILVIICSTLAVSMVTVLLLDAYAYARLKKITDDQLESLASRVTSDLRKEIRLGYEQLGELIEQGAGTAASAPSYSIFDSFALIDADGDQVFKAAPQFKLEEIGATCPTPLISVSSRQYFRSVSEFEMWSADGEEDREGTLDTAAGRFGFEVVRSRTTGRLEAILTREVKPAFETDRFASVGGLQMASIGGLEKGHAGAESGLIAALALPMWSVIDSHLIEGFGFAVIDRDGRVLFHSDRERSLHEDFFAELDRDRALRSRVFARRVGVSSVRYSGSDHRAFVLPVEGLPWSVVTFYDKKLLRTVNLEWLFGSILLIVFYVLFVLVVCATILLVRPAYRGEFMWPDPARPGVYTRIAAIALIMLVVFLLAIHAMSNTPLLWITVAIPSFTLLSANLRLTSKCESTGKRSWQLATGAVLVFGLLTLGRGPREPGNWAGPEVVLAAVLWAAAFGLGLLPVAKRSRAPVVRPYRIALYLVVLSMSVLPAVAFFKTAHRIQVESFVKYGQLDLAGDEAARKRRLDALPDEVFRCGGEWVELGRYNGFFNSTKRTSVEALESCCRQSDGALPEFLEAVLPHHSEYSVRMRQLLHDRASDKARCWRAGERKLTMLARDGGGLALVSDVPRLLPSGEDLRGWLGEKRPLRAPVFFALFGLFLGGVFWHSNFVARRVFLIDVMEPIWSMDGQTLPSISGENFFVVREDEESEKQFLGGIPPDEVCTVCLAEVARGMCQQRPGAARQQYMRAKLEKTKSVVRVEEFEEAIRGRALQRCALQFLEAAAGEYRKTIVILAAEGPLALCAAWTGDDEELKNRWCRLFEGFTVVDAERSRRLASLRRKADQAEVEPPAGVASVNAHPAGRTAQTSSCDDPPPETVQDEAVDPPKPGRLARLRAWYQGRESARARKALEEETEVDPLLGKIGEGIQFPDEDDSVMHSKTVLDEFGERAERYYERLWLECSEEEKVILVHLAEEGLANEKNRRGIRSLLGRGLIRRTPRLRIMNETFRRFVLEDSKRAEVAESEKRATEASAWEKFKWPFAAIVLIVGGFFFATQKELFNATIGVITGVAAGLPVLVRLLGVFGARLVGGGESA